jgi:hypothetical protein
MHETHNGPTAALERPFTDQEWQNFQKDDVVAGGMIVGLMTAIFTVGLFLYATIAFIAWSPPV